jgi:energy-coupling factor transport system permease protein
VNLPLELSMTRDSWLSALDPRLKLAALAAISLVGVLVDSLPALAAVFAAAMLLAGGLRLRPRAWLLVIGILLATAWGTVLSQAIFYGGASRSVLLTLVPPGEILGWSYAGLGLSREGAVYGLVQSLRILAVTLAGLAVCISTSPERLVAALSRLRVPVAISFMTVAALRFVPTMIEEWATVRRAARLRGAGGRRQRLSARWRTPRWSGWSRRWKLELALLLPVLAASLRRANALATAITCRGFDATQRRTFYPELRFSIAQRTALVGIALLVGSVSVVKSLYWLAEGHLYRTAALERLYQFARDWL